MHIQKIFPSFYNNKKKFSAFIIISLLFTACFVRLALFFNHKDMWLDELVLAQSILKMDMWELLTKPLLHSQSAPLGFVVISEFIVNQYFKVINFYILPLVSSLILIFITYKFMKEYFNSKHIIVYISLFIMSKSLIFYSTEFKQYMTEALVAFLVTYYFIKNAENICEKISYTFLSILCIGNIFSSSIPIIIISIACAIIYKLRSLRRVVGYIKNNYTQIIVFILFYISYYSFWLKRASIESMQTYWNFSFFPLDMNAILPWFKNVFLKATAYIIYIPKNIDGYNIGSLFFLIFFFYGSYILFRKNKNIFFCTFIPLICLIFLSACKLYPVGHTGIIGSRLILFLHPLVLIPLSVALVHVTTLLFKKNFYSKILIVFLSMSAVYSNIQYVYYPYRPQQTEKLVKYIQKNYTSNTKIIVHSSAKYAYETYSREQALAYTVFDRDKNIIPFATDIMRHTQKAFFFFSHYDIAIAQALISYAHKQNFTVIRLRESGAELVILLANTKNN